MNVSEQYFPLVLFIMQYKVIQFQLLNLWDEVGLVSVTIQMKATELYIFKAVQLRFYVWNFWTK